VANAPRESDRNLTSFGEAMKIREVDGKFFIIHPDGFMDGPFDTRREAQSVIDSAKNIFCNFEELFKSL